MSLLQQLTVPSGLVICVDKRHTYGGKHRDDHEKFLQINSKWAVVLIGTVGFDRDTSASDELDDQLVPIEGFVFGKRPATTGYAVAETVARFFRAFPPPEAGVESHFPADCEPGTYFRCKVSEREDGPTKWTFLRFPSHVDEDLIRKAIEQRGLKLVDASWHGRLESDETLMYRSDDWSYVSYWFSKSKREDYEDAFISHYLGRLRQWITDDILRYLETDPESSRWLDNNYRSTLLKFVVYGMRRSGTSFVKGYELFGANNWTQLHASEHPVFAVGDISVFAQTFDGKPVGDNDLTDFQPLLRTPDTRVNGDRGIVAWVLPDRCVSIEAPDAARVLQKICALTHAAHQDGKVSATSDCFFYRKNQGIEKLLVGLSASVTTFRR